MERDLADDLDDLICSGPLDVGGSDYDYLYKIAGVGLMVWISVAILVYLTANYLIQSPTNENATDVSVSNDISTVETSEQTQVESTKNENVIPKEVSTK